MVEGLDYDISQLWSISNSPLSSNICSLLLPLPSSLSVGWSCSKFLPVNILSSCKGPRDNHYYNRHYINKGKLNWIASLKCWRSNKSNDCAVWRFWFAFVAGFMGFPLRGLQWGEVGSTWQQHYGKAKIPKQKCLQLFLLPQDAGK